MMRFFGMIRTRTIRAAALAALAIILSGCDLPWGGKKEAATPSAPAAKPGLRLFPVRVQTVAVQPLKYEIYALGAVEAHDVFQVHALVPGTLYDVDFNEGDKIAKDALLCRIAPEAYKFTAQKAEGVYKNAVASVADMKRKMENDVARKRVSLREAESEIGRRKEAREAGGISTEEIQVYESKRDLAAVDLKDMQQASETAIAVLEASVVEKDAALKIAQDDVRKSSVRAPIGGEIEKRAVTSGRFVQPGALIATIVDRSQLKLRFKVMEKDSAMVKPGQKILFSVPAWPGRTFEADVYFISNQLDLETRSVDCLARITKQAEMLKPNYFASARMTTGGNDQAVVVPSTSVLPTEKGFVAFVVKDGKAEQRLVKTGLTVTDNSIEVLSGLKAGETLVVEGSNALQDGSGVRVLNSEAPNISNGAQKSVSDAAPEVAPVEKSKDQPR